jgi:predicted nucleic acid-binding protein
MNLDAVMVGGLSAQDPNELKPHLTELTRYGVVVRDLSSSEISELVALERFAALSVFDREAVVVARAESATLLTGDGPLRHVAESIEVKVRGVLGELERLVAGQIVTPPFALAALEVIIASGSRLPADECERAQRRWRKRSASSD